MATRRKQAQAGGRNEQVIRTLDLVRTLARMGGCDVYELAQKYGTTVRTIRRDLEGLQEAGILLKKEPAQDSSRVRYSLDTGVSERLSGLLDVSHYLALRLVMAQGAPVTNTSHVFATLEDLAERIEKAVGEKGRAQLEAIHRCFLNLDKFAWRSAPLDVVLPLVDAIATSRACEVEYRAPSSGNKPRRYVVLPLRLFVFNGSLYVHAWSEKWKQVLLLNLQRLQHFKPLKQTMAPPPGYDGDALQGTAFGIFIGPEPVEFVLRFDAFARPYIEERIWHPTEARQVEKDGRLTLRFRCPPSYEVTNWVAGWREHVEVLAPKSLREELQRYGDFLRRTYPV
jgi:predicted DNA-binding transcriptional regulator YafY